ncbi:MAG: hydantoinase B/oxoprolinase family protein [Burkholderiaceae bacterium]
MDAVRLAVLKGRLEQIADEMDATLYRSAFNPIIAEAHDASHGLYDAVSGDTLIQGKSGLPVFVGAMAFAVRAAIGAAARQSNGLQDGDIWVFNDPYDGGTHLNDFKLVQPFFYQGQLFCCLASVGHWHDVGGAVPGNYNPAATECWAEGMLIPPVRLVRGGEWNQDVYEILKANTRLPNSLYGDLNGQLAALKIGYQRLTALLDDYGADNIAQALSALRARAVTLMRSNIASLPEGSYSCEDYLDNDGIVDEPLKIAVTMRVEHKAVDGYPRLTIDFTGTSPMCAGPVNIARSTAIAACYVALKHIFPEVPANAGVLDPVEFIIDDNALINATKPRPVGGYTETILRMIDVMFGAMAQARPASATAMAYGTINALSIAGKRSHGPDKGKSWVLFSFFGGGHGAHPKGDGLSHGNAPISMATIPPLEILEASYPVAFTEWALRANSGGNGQHRGGLGAIYEIELLEQNADAFVFGERSRFAPQGVVGGQAGACNRVSYCQSGQWSEPPMASKQVGINLQAGDRIRIESPGGGGFGPPSARKPSATQRDLELGYVTTATESPNQKSDS